jgi:Cys-rich repeat protein
MVPHDDGGRPHDREHMTHRDQVLGKGFALGRKAPKNAPMTASASASVVAHVRPAGPSCQRRIAATDAVRSLALMLALRPRQLRAKRVFRQRSSLPSLFARKPCSEIATMILMLGLGGCGKANTISLLPDLPDRGRQTAPDAGGAHTDAGPPGCRSDTECPATRPRCDMNTKECTECVTDRDCSTGICNPATHTCGCKTNADCSPLAPTCDLDVHICVECESNSQCPAGDVCAFESHRCAPACQTRSDCAGSGRPICAMASRVCVECTTDSDCVSGGRRRHCNLFNGTCVECLSDPDCSAGRCQLLEHLCVECLTGSDCNGHVCDSYQCRT